MSLKTTTTRVFARVATLLALGLTLACHQGIHRFDRETIAASLEAGDSVALVLGEFPLTHVIDGDTIRVAGLDASLRLLGLDTEETFKRKSEWMEFDKGWERYLADAQARTSSPVKIPTPLGEEAKKFAVAFFEGVRSVRLERDHPKEIRDFYNRYLAYVFVEKDGETYNYNVECVRAGMSPYFSKYGYSRRFHQDFVDAQNEARAARRGIWDPSKQHYTDYDRRLEWWDRRAEFIKAFEEEAEGRSNWIILTNWDSVDRLQGKVGREVVVLGSVGAIRETAGPTKVLLSRRQTGSLPLIFFDKDALARSGALEARGEFIRARGVITKYFNKYKKKDELQIVVTLPGQIERFTPAPEPAAPEDPVQEDMSEEPDEVTDAEPDVEPDAAADADADADADTEDTDAPAAEEAPGEPPAETPAPEGAAD